MRSAFLQWCLSFGLVVYLSGGGLVCMHQIESLFASECHCCHHDHDHGEDEPCDHHIDCYGCNCEKNGFTGEVPETLTLREPGKEVAAAGFTIHDFTWHGPEALSSPKWQHPPPRLPCCNSPAVLQRFLI